MASFLVPGGEGEIMFRSCSPATHIIWPYKNSLPPPQKKNGNFIIIFPLKMTVGAIVGTAFIMIRHVLVMAPSAPWGASVHRQVHAERIQIIGLQPEASVEQPRWEMES